MWCRVGAELWRVCTIFVWLAELPMLAEIQKLEILEILETSPALAVIAAISILSIQKLCLHFETYTSIFGAGIVVQVILALQGAALTIQKQRVTIDDIFCPHKPRLAGGGASIEIHVKVEKDVYGLCQV